ncbi:VOC family protein [Pseudohalioglobus sediminis]|uniref:VOC family protein n=1 Tax=Pseudohalioglobus sediminis TaxID=2606449 RepID=A0A5B0WQS3_9GAMM|nr:VOC family protein [Pseudohalioglobus sediminis]KAA1188541.1 VOC family protein [Pseudohalioglobus sediminis]
MISGFDRIILDVPDLHAARRDYEVLLGPLADADQIRLANVDIQLQAAGHPGPAGIRGLDLRDDALPPGSIEPLNTDTRKLALARTHFRDAGYSDCHTRTGIYAVDHVVLQSNDADDCIRLFNRDLGLRLALDQEVPEWGGRMLFFRHGKMTLEVIQSTRQPPEQDFFWGITYLCRDIDETVAVLDASGVAHSPIRTGRKPGTRVTTIKSHCLGLPTLVIGPD